MAALPNSESPEGGDRASNRKKPPKKLDLALMAVCGPSETFDGGAKLRFETALKLEAPPLTAREIMLKTLLGAFNVPLDSIELTESRLESGFIANETCE